MKYIIVQSEDVRLPIPFPGLLNHIDVAKAYLAGEDRRHSPGKVISAGFYNQETGETYGRSESLNLDPLPDDAGLIKTFLEHGEGMLLFANHALNQDKDQRTEAA